MKLVANEDLLQMLINIIIIFNSYYWKTSKNSVKQINFKKARYTVNLSVVLLNCKGRKD